MQGNCIRYLFDISVIVMRISFFLLVSFFFAYNSQAQDTEEVYMDGYYYTKDSTKVTGKIYYAYSWYSRFKFKPTEEDQPNTVEASETIGFVIGDKQFVVKENFGVSLRYFMRIRQDFVEVIEDGNVSLYKHYSSHNIMNLDGSTYKQHYENYLLEKDGKLVTGYKNENTFAKEVANLLIENKELSDKIRNKELRLKDVESIVLAYNSWYSVNH